MSQIVNYLKLSQELQQQVKDQKLGGHLKLIRDWQCKRLLTSYNFLYNKKKYHAAMDFFTQELYGPTDFSERDKEIEKVLPMMQKVLSKDTLDIFELALRLNYLSLSLDVEMAKRLPQKSTLTTEVYADIYKACDNPELRQQQLDYIELIAYELAKIAQRKSIMLMLKLSRKPAKLAGLGELQRILENGAEAFKSIGKVNEFIDPILLGERKIMLQLFQGNDVLPQQMNL
ncbi:MAG: hypothetical protein COW84_06630 [Gammaproteobacteria bacterium CG22_combo_CG10-13_8_21_14_all_40_8]|nr:MAG: hypothetical protein COW84_06630 [Gammaproteobacteria bacterium CG22_combo_CG10-13_8_21_14_all_40_8]